MDKLQGFLNINKPQGPTSFDIIRKLKKVFPRKTKLGHLGTLDPMAQGVLPAAIGQATKIIPYIEDEYKEYVTTMVLGGNSDTQDAWGNITLGPPPVNVDLKCVEQVMNTFQGNIKQIPPMFSAVHHEGQRLYDLARQGITVERAERDARIEAMDLVNSDFSLEYPQITFRVICSRGTYIRTLCHDIGEKLGTGAFMSALLRSRVGAFCIEDAVLLDDILDGRIALEECMLPMDYPLYKMMAVEVKPEQQIAVLHGNPLILDQTMPTGKIKIYSAQQELLAIANSEPQDSRTLIKPVRVF
ncbi:MAG: tRNA pseudouridine(55) synthase TruB [Syntrophomonas sp.]